jgi:hypothetical protein
MINRPITSLLGSAVPMAQEQFGYTPTQMMAGSAVPLVQQQLGYTRQPPMVNVPVPQIQTPAGLSSLLAPAPQQKTSMLSGLLSGPGSSARYGALAKALTQNSATPMSLGQRITGGLLAGSDAAKAQEEAAFKRGLLEREMALEAEKVRLKELEITGKASGKSGDIFDVIDVNSGSIVGQVIGGTPEYLSEIQNPNTRLSKVGTTTEPKIQSEKISTETPVQYMVRQDDGTYKKEFVQSITIDGKEGLYKSVPKTEENPRGIKEVSLLDLGEIPEPSEGMTSVAVKLYDEANEAKRSVNNLSSFQTQVSKGFEGGLKGKITGWTGDAKSFFGVDLTEKEGLKKLLVAKQNSILGQNRVAIVGPGVMTQQDADKVIAALGGDINSWFANPQVLIDAIQRVKEENKDIFISKLNAYNALREGKFPELETPVDIFSAPPQYLAQGLTQEDWLADV